MPKGVYDRSKAKPHSKTRGRPAGADKQVKRVSPEVASVCLTCTAKKCTGAAACSKRRKKELAE